MPVVNDERGIVTYVTDLTPHGITAEPTPAMLALIQRTQDAKARDKAKWAAKRAPQSTVVAVVETVTVEPAVVVAKPKAAPQQPQRKPRRATLQQGDKRGGLPGTGLSRFKRGTAPQPGA